ncbi:aldo/keto reductase [Thalassospira sp.]|uniref:aldo/keto reductase n=1 Tax=Thalassospira sp. TaxID=1912094 RepID=UPI0032F02363
MSAVMAIGTAQFGMDYGISNETGKLSSKETKDVLDRARAAGIGILDTAPAYGASERILAGSRLDGFSVITKTIHLPSDAASQSELELEKIVRAGLDRSLELLGAVDGMLVHQYSDLMGTFGPRFWDILTEYRGAGLVRRIGMSIYDGEQIDHLLSHFDVDLVQLPFNILDQRLLHSGHLARLKNANVEIHARSLFLQGLLVDLKSQELDYFTPWRKLLTEWNVFVADSGRTAQDIAISFVRGQKEIDVAVIGVTSCGELEECLQSFEKSTVNNAESLACDDAQLLNPGNWKI